MFRWIRNLLARRQPAAPSEGDTPTDPAVANSRPAGGDRSRDAGDESGTTGPGGNDTFVGRAAGQDLGYAGETGAEARAQAEKER